MRFLWLAAALVGTLGAAAGCGGDDTPPPADNTPSAGGKTAMVSKGGSSNKGGSSVVPDAGGAGGEGGSGEVPVDPLGPIVTITSPEQLDDPNDGGVLVGADVEVTCLVKKADVAGAEKVDSNSVKLARLVNGKPVDEKAGMTGAIVGEYTAKFSLTEAEWGRIRFRCTAESTDSHVGSDTNETFLDKGPIITFTSPVADTAYPLSNLLKVEFTVEPARLTADDAGAAVSEVSLEVAGVPIDLSEAELEPGSYSLDIDLRDASLFNQTPIGPTPVEVFASNQREPEPVQGRVAQTVLIDGDGPVITITNPTNKAVIGGKVLLTFTAADAGSGVDPATVHVSLNNEDESFDPNSEAWGYQNSVFTYEFDSRTVEGSLVQVTVNIGATDKVGNASAGASSLLYLDNYPPLVDLDPVSIRSATVQAECSHVFDPVGSAATNDYDPNDVKVVKAAIFPRALIWEVTNSIEEIPIKHIAGVDRSTARVYVRRESDGPLLVDTDGDTVCDDVTDVESGDSLDLTALTRNGNQWVTTGDENALPTMSSLECKNAVPPQGAQPVPQPAHLCTDELSDMWQVINHASGPAEPVVYAYGPTADKECTGVAWEFTNVFAKFDGWACVAARAVDNAGNVGISRPLRVCVDYTDVGGTPACANASTIPPTCTDACTPPPRVNLVAVRW